MSESLSDKAQHWQTQWQTKLNSAHAPYQCHLARIMENYAAARNSTPGWQ